MGAKLIRKSRHTIDSVLSKANFGYGKRYRVNMFGDEVRMGSLRYKCFIKRGIKCVECGIEGKYFAKECGRGNNKEVYHFNLYALDAKGKEILMTKDHIIPKSKGGKDHISNLQTMCEHCNCKKGSDIVDERIIISNETIY